MPKKLSAADIEKLFQTYATPAHVRRHCEKVAQVGRSLAEALRQQGVVVDPELTYQGGLLHDLLRVVDFRVFEPKKIPGWSAERERIWRALRAQFAGKDHADAGASVMRERGCQALARMIFTHKFARIIHPKEKPTTWEEKLVYYADKRVLHDRIVSLQERLQDGEERYGRGNDPGISKKAREAIVALEQEVYAKIKQPIGWLPEGFTA